MQEWTSLDAGQRLRAAQPAAERAGALNPGLNAFVSLMPGQTGSQTGPLAGMPYAAKDLFAARERLPTCGLDHGVDLGFAGDAEVSDNASTGPARSASASAP